MISFLRWEPAKAVVLSLICLLFAQVAVIPSSSAAPTVPITIELQKRQMKLVSEKNRRNLNQIFEFDRTPLANRVPVILMPGRAEEFQHSAWWKRFRQESKRYDSFERNFKLYAFIYDSKEELDRQALDFVQEMKLHFGDLPQERKAILVSYSLGGVISREAMDDPEIFERVHSVIAIGVPFHGSPLFDPDWFTQYMRPRNHSPIRKLWDMAIYRMYMMSKTNLTRGLKWNNFDESLPLFKMEEHEIHGDQVVGNLQAYQERPSTQAIKKKIVVYASYLQNEFTPAQPASLGLPNLVGNVTTQIPKEIIGALLPLYGSSVHAVFIYMNHQLANLPTFSVDHFKGKNEHIYRYNDGVIPLSSALYLPPSKTPYGGDLDQLVKAIDVPKARIFVNIDHMHLGEYSIIKNKTLAVDVIHQSEGKRTPNDWILYDLQQTLSEMTVNSQTQVRTNVEANKVE